jgi:hypothetical protein
VADKILNSQKREDLPFKIPGWVNWVAQDETGCWWGYSVEPLRYDHGWYENEVGDYIRLGFTEPRDWAGSLYRVAIV